jgi:thymidylate synthase (FAD)
MKVTYIDHMGSDLSVVNAARVSFGKKSEWVDKQVTKADAGYCGPDQASVLYTQQTLSPADKSLIQFLARGCTTGEWHSLFDDIDLAVTTDHDDELEAVLNHIRKMPSHWSPFAHTAISLHLKMPIFVARQVMKHTTGIEYNEVFRRYVDTEPEFYVPEVWRKRADNVKQGSGGDVVDLWRMQGPFDESTGEDLENLIMNLKDMYQWLLDAGVAPEQARMVLPQSMYTEVIATGNLYAWANMYVQRTDPHAQQETRELVQQIGDIISPLYPVSWEALTQ